jgi:hypothetical protein
MSSLPPRGRLFASCNKASALYPDDKKENKTCFSFIFRRNKNIVTSDTIGLFSRSISGLSGDGPGDDAVPMVPMPGWITVRQWGCDDGADVVPVRVTVFFDPSSCMN